MIIIPGVTAVVVGPVKGAVVVVDPVKGVVVVVGPV